MAGSIQPTPLKDSPPVVEGSPSSGKSQSGLEKTSTVWQKICHSTTKKCSELSEKIIIQLQQVVLSGAKILGVVATAVSSIVRLNKKSTGLERSIAEKSKAAAMAVLAEEPIPLSEKITQLRAKITDVKSGSNSRQSLALAVLQYQIAGTVDDLSSTQKSHEEWQALLKETIELLP